MCLGIFTDDDGVVNDDPERHDQRKQADHVNRSTDQVQHREGSEE